jgi:chemotaxis protein methyltransferase CheR
MTTNETTFFRDLRPFEILKTTVLPELMKKRAGDRVLNVWFAACSNGQEPYSFAMLLREHFPYILGWKVRLIASDISRDVLARAREGLYTQLEVNRGLPAQLLVKYFKKVDNGWQLNPEVRRMVEFQEINLAEAWPPLPRMDIVFMRNVLIYFGVDAKRTILARVRRILRQDCFLLLGGSETTVYLDEAFQPVPQERPALFQLRGSDRHEPQLT